MSLYLSEGVSTITGMGDYGFGGRYCLERTTPALYDELFTDIQAMISRPNVLMPAMNERAYGWALLALDFDCAALFFLDHDAERARTSDMLQVAKVFVQELEMHFTGYMHASAVIVRNDVHRYRIYFPGVAYIEMGAVKLLLRLVKRKLFGTELYHYINDDLDIAPTTNLTLRVHGTSKGNSIKRKYHVVATLADSRGNIADIKRLSIRPSAAHYARLLEDPTHSYLIACSTFARQAHNGSAKPGLWNTTVLNHVFNVDISDDESSEDSVFGSHSDDDDNVDGPTALLISDRLLVLEHKGIRAAVMLHGNRADSATVVRSDGSYDYIEHLNQHQLDEPVDIDDGRLLPGTTVALFTDALTDPKINSVFQFPLELLVYRKGFSPLDVQFQDGKYHYDYHASPQRRFNTDINTGNMAKLAALAIGRPFDPNFNIVSTSQTVDDEGVTKVNEALVLDPDPAIGTLVLEIEAGCGAGKTVFSLQFIDQLMRKYPAATFLCVTPRAQLCNQLCTKIRNISQQEPHYYAKGPWPANARICVSTLDSLVRCVAPDGISRTPTIVLLDEVELIAHHLATSDTFSTVSADGRLRTIENLMILLASARYVIAMDACFGFTASLFLSMIAIKRQELQIFDSLHYHHFRLVNHQQLKYTILSDDARRVDKIRDCLHNNKNVIVFEPSPRSALALASMFPTYADDIVVIHGKSDTATKNQFSSDPIEYLTRNHVRLLIHTTSVGVGISIDEPYFDSSFVTYRPFLCDDAIVQGSHRARHLEDTVNGVREINITFDPRMRRAVSRLASIPTIGDALLTFERNLRLHKSFFNKYSEMARVSGFDGRVKVDFSDINTVFIAAITVSSELAVSIQSLVCQTRATDQATEFNVEGQPSDADARKEFREAERSVVFRHTIDAGDTDVDVRSKIRLVHNVGVNGIDFNVPGSVASPSFMGRLTLGMSHPSNLRRFFSLLVYLNCSQVALRRHVIDVLNNVTETAPMFSLDETRGITVGLETLVAVGALTAIGFKGAADLTVPKLRPTVDNSVLVEGFDGNHIAFADLFEHAQRIFKSERWLPSKRSDKPDTRVRQFLNCYLGGQVFSCRSPFGFDTRQFALSAELVPGYCRANSLDCPPEVTDYCVQFVGTWANFIRAEESGVRQLKIF